MDHRPLTTIRIGIVADDLTGAADAAVQFVRAGWKTELQLRPSQGSASVVAISTDSRALNAPEAAALATTAVKRHLEAGMTHLYKKIDSTLRGPIRAEVRAVLETWSPRAIAIVCPAFPSAGRTVIDGQLRVNGVPVAETAVGADPVTPVTESHIPTLLGATHVKPKSRESAQQVAEQISASGPIVVVDAATERDLQLLANAVALLGRGAVAVGSAGLACHLAIVWATRGSMAKAWAAIAPDPSPLTPFSSPALVIVTSLQDVARRQAAAVAAAGGRHHQPALEDLIDDTAWARWSENVLCVLNDVDTTVLLTSPIDRGENHLAKLIPKRFAELAARIVKRGHISGVVVTGGDGARTLVDALHATGINLLDEVITGVPIGILIGGAAEGLRIVTKAGGFGDDDTLVQAVEAVRHLGYDQA